MKKVTAVLLMLVMIFSFAACGDKDSSPTISASGTKTTHLLDKYIDINKTGKYIINFSYPNTDGTTSPMSITLSGTDKKLITFTLPKSTFNTSADLPISFLINGDKKYLVFSSMKAYAPITDDDLNISSLQTLITNPYLNLKSLAYKGKGTTTVDNVSYTYEDYLNPVSNQTRRFLFNSDKNLVMQGTVDNDTVAAYEKIEILGDVNDDLFQISTGFNTSSDVQQFADTLIAGLKGQTTAAK